MENQITILSEKIVMKADTTHDNYDHYNCQDHGEFFHAPHIFILRREEIKNQVVVLEALQKTTQVNREEE